MKRAFMAFLLLAVGASPVFAGIQKGQFEFSPTVGVSLPVGDVSDFANPGYLIGGRLGYNVSSELSIGLEANLNTFGTGNMLKNIASDLDITSLEYLGDVRLLLGDVSSSVPYVKGMLGSASAKLRATSGGLSNSLSETEVAYGVGAGFLFKGDGNVRGFFEAVYIGIATSGSTSTYISLRGGVSFFLGGKSAP
jgi:Outer membrane protein beta-barrel domain